MNKRFGATAIAAALAAGALTATAGPAGATDDTLTVSGPRVVAHFNPSAGQTPEDVAVEPDGSADIVFSEATEVARVTLDGRVTVLGQLPHTGACAPNPVALSLGLVRLLDGTLFVVDCTGDANTGVWRITPGLAPVQIASLPANSFPNDMAFDPLHGQLYVADSALATVWRIPIAGGAPVAWISDAALAKTSFIGANGIAVHGGAVWVSNTDMGTIVRIPIQQDGTAGAVQTVVTGLAGAIDNFTFVPGTDLILAALVVANEVVLIQNGQAHPLLTGADGLSNPTSVAVQRGTLYVGDGAIAGGTDPNLLIAHIDS
jgi:DNA-binding beta-propeller fold protein YncE